MARIRIRNRNPDPESRELITFPNLASMEAFISNFQSNDPRCNRIISFCARHFPNTLSLKLSHLSISSPHLRANTFDVFAKALRSARSEFNITPMIRTEIKAPILECLIQESSKNPPSKALSPATVRFLTDYPLTSKNNCEPSVSKALASNGSN